MEKGIHPSAVIREDYTSTGELVYPQPILIKNEKPALVDVVNDCSTALVELPTYNINMVHEHVLGVCDVQEHEVEREDEDFQLIAMSIVTYDEDVKQNAVQDTSICYNETKSNTMYIDTVYTDWNGLNSYFISDKNVESHTVPNNASQLDKKTKPKKRKNTVVFPAGAVEPTMKIGVCSRTYSKKPQNLIKPQESQRGKWSPTTSSCNIVSTAPTSEDESKQVKPANVESFSVTRQSNPLHNATSTSIDIDNSIVTSSSFTLVDPLLRTEDCDSISDRTGTQRKAPKSFQCTVCSLTFSVFAVCVEHLKSHTDKEVLSAHLKSKNASMLTKHKKFLCDFCGIAFTGMYLLTSHIEKQHHCSRVYKCADCVPEKTFSNKNGLKVHIELKHGQGITCSNCDSLFNSNKLFKEHIKTHHVNPRQFSERRKQLRKCVICSKVFGSCSALRQHLRTHTGETPFQCSYCPRMFSRYDNMMQHECLHTGRKRYKCNKCDMTFLYSVPRNIHMQSHSALPIKCCIL